LKVERDEVRRVSGSALWEDPPPRYVPGEVRRALDRDLRAARDAGRQLLETEVAAVRRQANDLDRLERMMSGDGKVKTWDYTPKTQAAQAYLEAVRRLLRVDDDDDDPFTLAVRELEHQHAEQAARTGTAETLDTPGPDETD
jgi:hypothetical protein